MPARLPLVLVLIGLVAGCGAGGGEDPANEPTGRDDLSMSEPRSDAGRRNRLANETSPYLLQHAENPVDWYPWGPEALEKARKEDKPILLSIGYSACHWCHVMEHESFEDERIAQLMNEHFVNVKVDREERPDLDTIYMTAVQLMTGSGGWPLTVFLTPELEPFYGGTYFPPDDRFGRPGFPRVLLAVARTYREEREKVADTAGRVTEALNTDLVASSRDEELGESILERAYAEISSRFDEEQGGFGTQPKFPQAQDLAFLLRVHRRSGEGRALEMVRTTLDHMAQGGIYDHLGGGFHRYSTDRRWLVPHFEKMLYDNALLTRVYLEAYQLTGEARYARVARETLDYVLREMTGPEGGFYSTQDADSEGEEGKFFVWTPQEIDEVLGGEEGALFRRFYDVDDRGNFEGGRSILHVSHPVEAVAKEAGMEPARLEEVLKEGRARLFEARSERIPPGTDDKVLTAWNGLMIGALARAARVLGEPRYLEAASRAAGFLLRECRTGDGRLRRSYRKGESRHAACLDDYAFLIAGLLELFEAGFETRDLTAAVELTRILEEHYRDREKGGYFFTGDDQEELIARTKDLTESSTPSGNGLAALNHLRLWKWTGEEAHRDRAVEILRACAPIMERAPAAAATALAALDFLLDGGREIAVVGPPEASATRALLAEVNSRFLPCTVLVAAEAGRFPELAGEPLPLLEGKEPVNGESAAYVCRNYSCRFPVTDPAELAKLLDG
jgi:uncharacterized protein YyaL (SSP411 family)